ncbi:conserved hypothetical protein [Candidatus Competibacter denitrificans Run_A_D11]|uniref:DUF2760 domain-containing protein n=1 Tax=Candidatus Competibacter denitrificans Run_A_D11 TaxID=1400863 RepID=W6M0X4_9GAMM|nr:DUF2760 domain-containing protein [Candidatus Competibacter denitrificans]CDI01001.1 conserved hypothetical protein [Candidatus Competibacter denitrificans Run_A_D11]
MNDSQPGFFARLALALRVFGRILGDGAFAGSVLRLDRGESSVVAAPSLAEPPKPAPLRETLPESALQFLTLLQQEGRFVDFLEENVTAYSDAEIGGAARVVHEGCRKALRDYLQIEPIRPEAEGARLTLAAGFDPATVRLTGNVVGQPPFTGTLMHRGWRVAQITLPKLAEGHDVRILAPAEVEL